MKKITLFTTIAACLLLISGCNSEPSNINVKNSSYNAANDNVSGNIYRSVYQSIKFDDGLVEYKMLNDNHTYVYNGNYVNESDGSISISYVNYMHYNNGGLTKNRAISDYTMTATLEEDNTIRLLGDGLVKILHYYAKIDEGENAPIGVTKDGSRGGLTPIYINHVNNNIFHYSGNNTESFISCRNNQVMFVNVKNNETIIQYGGYLNQSSYNFIYNQKIIYSGGRLISDEITYTTEMRGLMRKNSLEVSYLGENNIQYEFYNRIHEGLIIPGTNITFDTFPANSDTSVDGKVYMCGGGCYCFKGNEVYQTAGVDVISNKIVYSGTYTNDNGNLEINLKYITRYVNGKFDFQSSSNITRTATAIGSTLVVKEYNSETLYSYYCQIDDFKFLPDLIVEDPDVNVSSVNGNIFYSLDTNYQYNYYSFYNGKIEFFNEDITYHRIAIYKGEYVGDGENIDITFHNIEYYSGGSFNYEVETNNNWKGSLKNNVFTIDKNGYIATNRYYGKIDENGLNPKGRDVTYLTIPDGDNPLLYKTYYAIDSALRNVGYSFTFKTNGYCSVIRPDNKNVHRDATYTFENNHLTIKVGKTIIEGDLIDGILVVNDEGQIISMEYHNPAYYWLYY